MGVGAFGIREIVPVLVGLADVQVALVENLVGALLEIENLPVVTSVIWVVVGTLVNWVVGAPVIWAVVGTLVGRVVGTPLTSVVGIWVVGRV